MVHISRKAGNCLNGERAPTAPSETAPALRFSAAGTGPAAADSRPVARPDSIPDLFWERLAAIVPPDRLEAVRATFSAGRHGAGRVNRLLTDADPVLAELRAAGLRPRTLPWYPDGFTVDPAEREALGRSQPASDGRIWLQNPSSMIPPLALEPEPGERVLDLAAAPGSKTLQLAALMRGEGELAAVELVRPRFFRLRRNLEQAGASFVRTFLRDGASVWRHRPDWFDRVLLDAPCSTEGRFRADDPETFAYWSPSKIRAMVRKQIPLLQGALRTARPGGVVVYSTCSFAPEENEFVIDRVLDWAGGRVSVEELPAGLPEMSPALSGWEGRTVDPGLAAARRILPDGIFEGFFVCRLRKLEAFRD